VNVTLDGTTPLIREIVTIGRRTLVVATFNWLLIEFLLWGSERGSFFYG
jgi:hypothetical protein